MAVEPTTRAYTLKLSGDDSWRHALWNTHATVNRGVRVWGDWLLTLRGGLLSALAENDPDRRVVLALSWLSVESPKSLTPQEHIVACGSEPTEDRRRKVTAAFEQILDRLKIANRDDWIAACEPALTARIRTDAVWVDRNARFNEVNKNLGFDLGFDEIWDLIGRFFPSQKAYFELPKLDGKSGKVSEGEKQRELVKEALGWLSNRFGESKGADFSQLSAHYRRLASSLPSRRHVNGATLITTIATQFEVEPSLQAVLSCIGASGHKSKTRNSLKSFATQQSISPSKIEELRSLAIKDAEGCKSRIGRKRKAHWASAILKDVEQKSGFPWKCEDGSKPYRSEYSVLLDHAARRLRIGHTWIQRAEAKRRKFQEDAAKIDDVPKTACEWLDDYCRERSGVSGAVEGYLIRKRAVEGWEKIVKRWSRKDCKSPQDRIDKARELQADPDIDKFGDIQLFEALAADDATFVWRNDKGKPDATILRDYVAARVAEHDRRRFKVPAYRHPDPLRHPVFVDFGNSRWSIEYAALKTVHDREKMRKKLAKAKTDKTREKYAQKLAEKPDLHGVTLSLWTGDVVEPHPLRWHGKRLRKDLDFDHFETDGATVSRADRLGRAVAGAPQAAVNIAQVFDQREWNGRLQAPRAELDRLADLIYGKKGEPDGGTLDIDKLDKKTRRQWERLNWFLSYSSKLQPAGPWLDYVDEHQLHSGNPSGIEYRKGRNGWYLNYVANKGRKSLARLPGLRILSVDLGERHAAACAVWETLSGKQFDEVCAQARTECGDDAVEIHDLYATIKRPKQRDKRGREFQPTTIYRRIGPDELNGQLHPAPWARLERQFLIKLQGEDRIARRARANEFAVFKDLCNSLGKGTEEPREELDLDGATTLYPRIDELMLESAKVARLGLRRHGNCARIAFALTSREKPISGGRTIEMDDEQRIRSVQNALVLWQELAGSRDYVDPWARQLWDDWVVGKFGGPQPMKLDETDTGSERKKKLNESREPLKPVAEQLLTRDNADLHKLWADEWESRIADFQKLLRRLRTLILPRIGKRPAGHSPEFNAWKKKAKQLRHVGGLSYTRLASIRGLYQLMRAFHMRPEPKNLRAGIERIENEAEAGNRFGLRMLHARDRLRENRVKQLASRLVEAALGVGSENPKHWELGRKRPSGRIDETHGDARFALCHAIVIENLERYRPDEKRTRRENRGLMNWAARNVRKYLMESCELHGLYFDEVDPRYTSRQDSRTGLPGMRCEEVSIEEFTKPNGYWQRVVAAAKKLLDKGGKDSLDRMLVDVAAKYKSSTSAEDRLLRIPRKGGKVFVAADENRNSNGALHADLNAAANIGIRALLDPDWEAAWWYVPINAGDGKPIDKLKGCMPIDEIEESLIEPTNNTEKKDVINVWSHLSSAPLAGRDWMEYSPYWNKVRWHIVRVLSTFNGLGDAS